MNQASNQITQTPQTMPQFYIGEINECLKRSIITIFNNVDHIQRGDPGEVSEPVMSENRYVTVKILSGFYIEYISMYLLNNIFYNITRQEKETLKSHLLFYIYLKKSFVKSNSYYKLILLLNDYILSSFKFNQEEEEKKNLKYLVFKYYYLLPEHEKRKILLSMVYNLSEWENMKSNENINFFNVEGTQEQKIIIHNLKWKLQIKLFHELRNNNFYYTPENQGYRSENIRDEICNVEDIYINNHILYFSFLSWSQIFGLNITPYYENNNIEEEPESGEEWGEDWEEEEEPEPEAEEKTDRERIELSHTKYITSGYYYNNKLKLVYIKHDEDKSGTLIYKYDYGQKIYDVTEKKGTCAICLTDDIYKYEFSGTCCPSSFCLSCIYKTNKDNNNIKCLICRDNKKEKKL
jgi:hypothetical protein